MKYPNYDHSLEPEILAYWQKNKIVEKLREKNNQGKKFYFLDGPPYTSGKFHLGHAWNYALKDICLRYKRMHGFKVWDRNGFDVHGLPTEHKVMAKYNLETKEDIQKFGVDKFVDECQKFCLEMAEVMTKDLIRMGVTLDVSNPYMALQEEYIEGEWDLIKTAFNKKKLYYGEKVLTWCQHCETAVAKHECEYKNVNDNSIFVKFPIKGKNQEYLVIWTTTPWTIPFNLAVMVNPELDYVKVEVEGEKWILAKALAGVVVSAVVGKKMQVVEEFKGEKLEGLQYEHPFAKYLPQYSELKKDHKNVHTVILSQDYVDTTAGSGLVHAAPGCGPEDQEACKPYDIPPFNALAENGYYSEEMGKFAGLRAKVDDKKFIQALEEAGALLASTPVEHEYPHCWRCKQPVVFRITYQWFFDVENIKKEILKENKDVHWVPDTALNSYESWIKNLKDNSISRQRYWGTPIPIWQCTKCNEVKAVGSKQDIVDNGGKVPQNLHIPWIDAVKLNCKCGEKMSRVPDIIDVWVDAGTASWNCLHNDKKLIKELYPADLVLEAREQTRLWFSMLNICSYLYRGEKSFENVYVYGMLNDIDGKKMSKSLGNVISPYELIDKHSVDVLRYYMCQNNAGEDIKFSWDECKVKERQLQILWNLHKLLINLCQENNLNPNIIEFKDVKKHLDLEEKYILSRLNSTIQKVTSLLENWEIDKAIEPLEELYLDLSRTYIQMVRDKSAIGSEEEKKAVIYTINKVLMDLLMMFNIFVPFISEAIYLNLKDEFKLSEESISHHRWPVADKKLIDLELETNLEAAKQVIAAALYAREKIKVGLRWPVQEIVVESVNKETVKAVQELSSIIKKQTNSKNLQVVEKLAGVKETIKPDFQRLKQDYAKLMPQIVAHLSKTKPEVILGELEKVNKYMFKVEKTKVEITREMLQITRETPKNYVSAEARSAVVYLNTERDTALEAEGYAREVMRNVQNLRKQAGLQKTDSIKLSVQTKLDLNNFAEDIKAKVGASKLVLSDKTGKGKHSESFKVKDQEFKVWFD